VKKLWRVLGSAVLLGVLAFRVDWVRIAAAFSHLNWWLWLLALVIYVGTQVVSGLRWRLLAQAVGLQGPRLWFIREYFIGMFFSLFLPTSVGGDVVRAWRLARQPGPPTPGGRRLAAVLSVLADRVNGLLVLIALACTATAVCTAPLRPWVVGTVLAIGAAAALGLASLPLWRFVLLPRLTRAMPRLAGPLGALQRLADGAAVTLSDSRVLLFGTALSMVVQAANVVVVWLVGVGLGLDVPFLFYGVLVPLVTLLTLLPVSVNGVGLRETGLVVLLAPLGVGATEAVTLGLLSFAVYSASGLTGVFFLFGGRGAAAEAAAPDSLEVQADDEPVGGDPDQGRARQPPAAA
jgi:uncharacterized membrane protein YbhN (UPF0104 family)